MGVFVQSCKKSEHSVICVYQNVKLAHVDIHLDIHYYVNMAKVSPMNSCMDCHSPSDENSFISHVFVHTGDKPYKCNICDEKIVAYRDSKVHLRVHTGEKPYKCNICDMYNADSHMETHTGEKPYQCFICAIFVHNINVSIYDYRILSRNKCVSSVISMKKWIKSQIHTKEKPCKCKYCVSGFKSKSDQTIHLKVHTGEKPSQCSKSNSYMCGKYIFINKMQSCRIHEMENFIILLALCVKT